MPVTPNFHSHSNSAQMWNLVVGFIWYHGRVQYLPASQKMKEVCIICSDAVLTKKKKSKEKKDFCWEEPTKNCRYLMLQHQTTLHFAVFHCLYSGATDVHRHNSCLNCCVAGGRPLSEPYAAELQQFDENLGNQPIVSNGLSSGHLIPRATDGTTILLILKL